MDWMNAHCTVFAVLAMIGLAFPLAILRKIWKRYVAACRFIDNCKSKDKRKPSFLKPVAVTILILGCYATLVIVSWTLCFDRPAKSRPLEVQSAIPLK